MYQKGIKVFSNRVSNPLAEGVCKAIDARLGRVRIERFNDGETFVQILEDVRDSDVFIIGSTQMPEDNSRELKLLVDAAKRAAAGRITMVIPYLAYNRQDRKHDSRVPLSAQLFIQELVATGPDQVLLFDLHSEITAGFFFPLRKIDHIYGSKVTVPYFQRLMAERPNEKYIVAGADVGSSARARRYASFLQQEDFVIFNKTREAAGKIRPGSIRIVGDVSGAIVILVDDMIDTGGTIVENVEAAMHAGAKEVYVCATHGTFSKNAVERLETSRAAKIIVTDSFTHSEEKLRAFKKIEVLSVAPLLGNAIRRLYDGRSLSELILS